MCVLGRTQGWKPTLQQQFCLLMYAQQPELTLAFPAMERNC